MSSGRRALRPSKPFKGGPALDGLKGAEINRDRNLRLQYLAGMWLNSKAGEQIRSSIVEHYRFPDQMFVGSPEGIRLLKLALTISSAANGKDYRLPKSSVTDQTERRLPPAA